MPITPPTPSVTLRGPSPQGTAWQIGQRLEAVLVSGGAKGQSVQLRIGGQQFSAQLPFDLPTGSRVQLQVVQGGPQPLMRIVTTPPSATVSTPPPQTGPGLAAPPSLPAMVSAQGSQAPLLAMLWALHRQPESLAALPPAARSAAEAAFSRLASVADALTSQGLRNAFDHSGLFREAGLAGRTGSTTPQGDLKSALLSAAARLRSVGGAPAQPAPTSASRAPMSGTGGTSGSGPGTPGAQPATASPPPVAARSGQPPAAAQVVRQTPTASPGSSGAGSAPPPPAGPPSPAAATAPVPPQGATVPVSAAAVPVAPTTRSSRDVPPPRPGTSPVAQARAATPNLGVDPQPMIEALRTATDRALARLALHQWAAVESTTDTGSPRWLVELPLRSEDGIDLVHLLMEREQKTSAETEDATWRVELAMDLPELGPVHVRISVSADRVTARIWAEQSATFERAVTELPRLRAALEDRQLKVRDLGCNPGPPPPRPPPEHRTTLLDDQA